MPGIVADTGPINYLVLIGAAELLPALFGSVILPTAVGDELAHPKTPAAVRAWMAQPPAWLTVRPAAPTADPRVAALGNGERDTIALATELDATLILMDERAGVAVAQALGRAVTGTLGVLQRAARRDLVDLGTAFAALAGTSFHYRQELFDHLLREDRARRGGGL